MSGNKHTSASYYNLLTRNMILSVIIVSFTPMILVIGILLYQFNISYHEKTYAHLEELIGKYKQNIDTFLTEKLANIRFLSDSASFEELTDKATLRRWLETLREEYGDVFVDLGVVDEAGNQLTYAGPYELHNVRYSDASWFSAAIRNRYFISDVFMGFRGSPHFIISIRKTQNNRLWILRATIDFKAFNHLVENLRVGKTGCAFILNRKGAFQTRPSFESAQCSRCYNYFIARMNPLDPGVHIFDRADPSGTKNIYAIAGLKEGDWLLIFKQEKADAFSDLTRMFNIAAVIFFLGAAAIMAMAVLLSHRMVRRIQRTDAEKEKLNQQMVETGKLASVGELAAGIAHEINNPVAIMVEEAGWIGDLLEEEEFAESTNLKEFNRALAQIRTQGRRCKEITHKLLSFARRTDSTVKDVQINDLISEIAELSFQMARYSKIAITTDLQPNLPYVTLSPSEMQQVLLNLINNAMEAMEKNGGTVHISTRHSKLEKDHLVITVADNGPGIPAANLAKIFDPFFTTKPVGKGTGLGLSICYGIIQKMGGKIDVQSTLGQGTRFRIWIPYQATD